MRALIKNVVARTIGNVLDLDRIVSGKGRRYVLAYHRVMSAEAAQRDGTHDAMWVSPATFESQLRWMLDIGNIVGHDQLLDFDLPAARPLFALTFDDGWRDTFDTAFPIMRSVGVAALVFLVTRAMDDGALFWPEDVVTKTRMREAECGRAVIARVLSELGSAEIGSFDALTPARMAERWVEWLKPLREGDRNDRIAQYFRSIGAQSDPLQGYLMTWDDARAMQAAGMRFGSHSHNHRILKQLSAAEIELEVTVSKHRLEAALQVPIDTFCYPNARYRGTEAPILAAAGYRTAFCIDGRRVEAPVDPFYVPRFLMSERSTANHDVFRLHLAAAPGFAGKPHDPASPE